METKKIKTVTDYIASKPLPVREALKHLKSVIYSIVPDLTEQISYGIPIFKYNGKNLVGIGAAKAHCSFYVMDPQVMENLKEELKGYSTGKGTIHFTPEKPLAEGVVRRVVEERKKRIETGN